MKIKLAHQSDVPEGQSICVNSPKGSSIALFKLKDEIYALRNACPHMGGPLSQGELEGCTVTCPWHGWQFDFRTGNCQNMPGEKAITIPIEIKDGYIYMDEE